jgi:hypothetical protein
VVIDPRDSRGGVPPEAEVPAVGRRATIYLTSLRALVQPARPLPRSTRRYRVREEIEFGRFHRAQSIIVTDRPGRCSGSRRTSAEGADRR